jgi:hemoglobin/transferrin/lactoferrin receptor protein
MKKLGLSWFLLVACQCAFSQVIIVRDKITGEKLESVSIRDTGNNTKLETDFKGTAPAALFTGKSILLFERVGYQSVFYSYAELQRLQFNVGLESIPFGLEEIVVAATRWSQMSRNVPGRVISIRKKDRNLANTQTAADLLGLSGEVFIQKSQQAGGSPMIRGFSTNRLLYAVDGVRMNTAIFRGGNIQNVISLDAFATEKTEVFFGPGSIVYGSDAIGGVMSFQTIVPQFSNDSSTIATANGTVRFSSANGERTANASFSYGGKKWAGYTGITHSSFGNLRMGANGNDQYRRNFYVARLNGKDSIISNSNPLIQQPSGYDQINLTQKLRFRPHESWELNYGFHYSATSSYSRYDRLIESQSNGLPRFAVWDYGPQIWMMHLLSIQHKKSTGLYDQMMIRLAYQYFQESRIDRGLDGFRLRTNLEKVNAYSVNADFEKKINRHDLFYGLELVQNKVGSFGTGTDIRNGNLIPVPDRYPVSNWNSYAAFANYQHSLSDRLLLQGGIRMNAYQLLADFNRLLRFYPFPFTVTNLNNQSITYSFGSVYKPKKNMTIKFNWSKAFRAPNVDDMGKLFDFVSGEVVVPNPSLRAETADNVEFGIIYIFGKWAKLDMNIFSTRLQNALVRRPFTFNGSDSILYNGNISRVYAIQNASLSRIAGIQTGIEIIITTHLSLLSRYNFQSGQEEMPNGEISPARHAAPGFGMSRITYRKKDITFQVSAMYSGKVSFEELNVEERVKTAIYAKDAAGKPYSPGWYTISCTMNWQIRDWARIGAGVENITDRCYRPYASGIAAAGRNFYITLVMGRK